LSDEPVEYAIQVVEWDYYYSLHSNDPKSRWAEEALSELTTLDLAGDIIRPADGKLRSGKVMLSAKKEMLRQALGQSRTCIGSLSSRSDELSAYIFIPAERMSEIITAAQAGRIQFISLNATKLRYRSGLVYGLTLHTRDEEE
jgi:hypothetical protein